MLRRLVQGSRHQRASVRLYSTQDGKKRIKVVTDLINKYNQAYYVDAKSLVSDFEYDKLQAELSELEKKFELNSNDSPTQSGNASEVKEHSIPMLSLSNTYNEKDLSDFCNKIQASLKETVSIIAELKYDGIAMSLHYINGEFSHALTRGDGAKGEDATDAIKRYVKNIPMKLAGNLPQHLEVRGEIIIDDENFVKANGHEEGKQYSTKRNLAAGIMNRKKNTGNAANLTLTFCPYAIHAVGSAGSKILARTQSENLEYLKSLKFEVSEASEVFSGFHLPFRSLTTPGPNILSSLLSYISKWEKKRISLPFDIDGVVIKVDSFEHQKALGFTAKSPKWATAFKFPPKKFTTTLRDVVLTVGRSGKVTPVAVFDNVRIDGINVQRATLYNKKFVEDNKISIGRKITIERSGDVIPKVVSAEGDSASSALLLAKFDTCPCSLKQPLVSHPGKVDVFCECETCPVQVERYLTHFCSKDALNFPGMGPATISTLFEYGAIKRVSDIFNLHTMTAALKTIPGWGDKKVKNILDGIEERKKVATWAEILYGLGIPGIGSETANLLAHIFPTVEAFQNASLYNFQNIESIGGKSARSIFDFFNNPNTRLLLSDLGKSLKQMHHVNAGNPLIAAKDINPVAGSKFQGKCFVFTGKMESFTRAQAQDYAIKMGGTFKKDVGPNVDILVSGGNGESTKTKKAQGLGISLMSEAEFRDVVYDLFGPPH